jgi:hypothetical protein
VKDKHPNSKGALVRTPEKPTAENRPPRVLLTDTNRWALAARLAIDMAKTGVSVSAVCPTRGHPLLKTRSVQRTFSYSGLRPLDSLLAAVRAIEPDVIIPCDDRGVLHLHELHARARGASDYATASLIEHSLGSPESYPIVSARYELLRVAQEEGLRVPETSLVRSADDLKAHYARSKPPWVLKADGTFGGRGVKVAHTLEQAGTFFQELARLFGTGRVIKRLCVNRDPFWLLPWWNRVRPAVIVQSHIQGRPANCAVVCWQGQVLAGFGVEVVSAEGLTGPASVVRVIDHPEMMRCAERIAGRLGLSGFFGLDFMIGDESGDLYLIEMNPRCTPLCHLRLGKGRDMVGALWAQLSGQSLPEVPPVTRNNMIAYFPQAWTSKSEFLQSSYQDIPQDEPALIQELLAPWPDRSLLFRASNWLHELTHVETPLVRDKSSGFGG